MITKLFDVHAPISNISHRATWQPGPRCQSASPGQVCGSNVSKLHDLRGTTSMSCANSMVLAVPLTTLTLGDNCTMLCRPGWCPCSQIPQLQNLPPSIPKTLVTLQAPSIWLPPCPPSKASCSNKVTLPLWVMACCLQDEQMLTPQLTWNLM